MNEKIEQRISKLLEMANRGTPNEQKVALIKAQKLMLEYRINEKDLKRTEEVVNQQIHKSVNCYSSWTLSLVSMICANFRCIASWRTLPGHKGKRKIVFVLGLESDALICKNVLEAAYDMIECLSKSEVNKFYRQGLSVKGVKETFIRGFLKGLNDGFQAQLDANNQYALAVIVPEIVNQEAKTRFDFVSPCVNSISKLNDPTLFKRGYTQGKAFIDNLNRNKLGTNIHGGN